MASVVPSQAGGPKLEHDPDFDGPCKKRHCTDVLLLLLLLAAWVGMTVLGLVGMGTIDQCSNGLAPGEPKRLYNGVDVTGSVCGVNNTNPPCPNASITGLRDNTDLPYAYAPVSGVQQYYCVKQCPTAYGTFKDYDGNSVGFELPSTRVGGYCLPNAALAAANASLQSELSSYTSTLDTMDQFGADVSHAQNTILGLGFGVGIVVGFLVLRAMRFPCLLDTIVWGLVIGVGVCLGLLGVFLQTQSAKEQDAGKPSSTVDFLKGASYFFFACTAVYALVILFLRKRIKLAIGVVKEAAAAIGSAPLLILFPVLQTIGLAVFMVPWFIYGTYLVSSGELVMLTQTSRAFVYSENMRYALLFHLFVFFWTSQFIVAVGQLVVSLSVSSWYFTREKTISNKPFFHSMWLTLRYHLGTAAFGSLIIAIIETIRAVLTYVQKKAAKASDGSAVAKMLQVVLCVMQCCLWCLKKCMQFINKNAYIQTAIFGTSFCTSARKAFMLILRNIGRIAAVSYVGNIVLILFKLLVSFGTAFIAYLYFANQMSSDLNNPAFPALVVVFIGYAVACVFAEIFGMAISTILQCFVADEEMCGGSYAQNDLKKWLSQHGKNKGATSQVEPEG